MGERSRLNTPNKITCPVFQHSTGFDNSKDNVIFLQTEKNTNLPCLQKQLEAGHSKGDDPAGVKGPF